MPQFLFKLGNISVRQDAIVRGRSVLPLANVLSVMTETSFLLGKTVTVFDLARAKYKYTFGGSRDATAIIRAIQSAKPSVYVEKPDNGGFFVLWG
jgi:hypothetical protein